MIDRRVLTAGTLLGLALLTAGATSSLRGESLQIPHGDAEHMRLASMAGTWDVEMSLWLRPGGQALTTKGTSTIEQLFDGLFIQERIDAALNGAPLTTLAWTGYNSSTHKYEATRISSATGVRIAETGDYDQIGRQFDFKADYAMGSDTWHQRTVIQALSPDRMIATSYLSFGNVPEWKAVEIRYQRRP